MRAKFEIHKGITVTVAFCDGALDVRGWPRRNILGCNAGATSGMFDIVDSAGRDSDLLLDGLCAALSGVCTITAALEETLGITDYNLMFWALDTAVPYNVSGSFMTNTNVAFGTNSASPWRWSVAHTGGTFVTATEVLMTETSIWFNNVDITSTSPGAIIETSAISGEFTLGLIDSRIQRQLTVDSAVPVISLAPGTAGEFIVSRSEIGSEMHINPVISLGVNGTLLSAAWRMGGGENEGDEVFGTIAAR